MVHIEGGLYRAPYTFSVPSLAQTVEAYRASTRAEGLLFEHNVYGATFSGITEGSPVTKKDFNYGLNHAADDSYEFVGYICPPVPATYVYTVDF